MFRNDNIMESNTTTKTMLYTQKTLADTVACTGVGVHSGTRISLTLKPANIGAGINFVRTDVFDKNNVIPALYSNVSDTRLCTCLTNQDGVTIATIEHLMAAFHAAGITNATVEVSGAELPILDGSAAPFLFLIECAGIKEQNSPRKAIKILKAIQTEHNDAKAVLEPSVTGLEFDYFVDYPNTMVADQTHTTTLNLQEFKTDISQARTFGFLHEIEYLKQNGLARGGSLKNAIVVDGMTILNKEGLRYENEFVRHKIVDAVGDLYTAGYTIIGKYTGVKAGHMLNNNLLKELFNSEENYEIIDMNETILGKNYQDTKVLCD